RPAGAAAGTISDMARLVVSHEHAHDEIGREADEPDVLLVVGRAGLAGDWLADLLHGSAGAPQNHTFHHRGDLIGGHRVDHALTPIDDRWLRLVLPFGGGAAAAFALIVLVDGVAVTILNA